MHFSVFDSTFHLHPPISRDITVNHAMMQSRQHQFRGEKIPICLNDNGLPTPMKGKDG
jgi:hypothetical protein